MVMIGHAGHPEVIGTMGQLPAGAVILVETAGGRRDLHAARPGKLAYITQTTLSVDDTAEIVGRPRARFPAIVGAAQGGHLLRHHQPPGSGQGDRRR